MTMSIYNPPAPATCVDAVPMLPVSVGANTRRPASLCPAYRGLGSASTVRTVRPKLSKLLSHFSGQGGNRTPDTRIFSPLLYQLSYLAGTAGKLTTAEHAGQRFMHYPHRFRNSRYARRFPTRAVTTDLIPPRVLKSPTTSIHRG